MLRLGEELQALVEAAEQPVLIEVEQAERMLDILGLPRDEPVILCRWWKDGDRGRFHHYPWKNAGAGYDWPTLPAERLYDAVAKDFRLGVDNFGFVPERGGIAYDGRKEITEVRFLKYEIDDASMSLEAQFETWRRAGLPPPSLVLFTGGKSLHFWWRLKTPLPLAEGIVALKRLQKAIRQATPGVKLDPKMESPAQPMRLAGGIHPGTRQRSTIYAADGAWYEAAEILKLCPAIEVKAKAAKDKCGLFRAEEGEPAKPGEYPEPDELMQPVPLRLGLSHETYTRIHRGDEEGVRVKTAWNIGQSLQESKAMIEALGYRVDEDPKELFEVYCRNSDWCGYGGFDVCVERHFAGPDQVGIGQLSKSALRRAIAKWAEDEGHWRWRPNWGGRRRAGDDSSGIAQNDFCWQRPSSPSWRYETFKRYVRLVVRCERNTLRRNIFLRDALKRIDLRGLIQPAEVASLVMEAQDVRAGNSYRALSDIERKAMAKPKVEWVIAGAIPKRDLTAAVGRPKVGKTRKAIAAAKSVLTGCDFMGFKPVDTAETVVILITDDQSAGDTADMLEAAGLYEHPRLLWSQRFRLTEEQLDQLLSDIKNNPGALVVVDSLRSITRSSGAKENDAEMGMLVYDLKQSVIDAGGSLLLVHHGNKEDKAVGMEAMSGHNSIAGACNTILSSHYLEDERGFACKDSPLRRVVREARSGQGADLVVEIKTDGSFERIDSFDGFARGKLAADLQEQELAALRKPPKPVVALVLALVQLFEEDKPHLPTLEVMRHAGLVRQAVNLKADLNRGEQAAYTTCNEWINKLIKFEMLELRPDESGLPGAARRRLYKLNQKGRDYAHTINCGVS